MAAYPGSNNTYVPSHEASGKLQVEFSRNPKRFRLNLYIKSIPVTMSSGYYLVITAEQAARASNLQSFIWHDGQEAPMGNDNLEKFVFDPYVTKRYAFPYNLGQKATSQATWDILATHGRMAAQQAMTARTIAVLDVLTTTGNWAGNTDTASNIVGGYLDAATTTNNYLKNMVQEVCENIEKTTIGVAEESDIIMVMSPATAHRLSRTAEVVDLIKQSPNAYGMLTNNPQQFGTRGLPPELYGVKTVVENAVKITTKKGASTTTRSYCLAEGTIIFVTRPEGLVGSEGVPEFSTAQLFVKEDMTVETKSDPDNRRELGRVVDDYVPKLAAPGSGYLVTSAFSS